MCLGISFFSCLCVLPGLGCIIFVRFCRRPHADHDASVVVLALEMFCCSCVFRMLVFAASLFPTVFCTVAVLHGGDLGLLALGILSCVWALV